MDLLKFRKSVRRFKDKKVEEDVITEILSAAMQAPSAGNEQPWDFVVIREREIINKIMEFHPFSHALSTAGVAIVVCGDKNKEKFNGFWVLDCAAATENILIASEHFGLGAVWLGIYPLEDRIAKLKSILNLPDSVIPLSIVPIGYPDENRKIISRYDVSRIHYNKW